MDDPFYDTPELVSVLRLIANDTKHLGDRYYLMECAVSMEGMYAALQRRPNRQKPKIASSKQDSNSPQSKTAAPKP